MFTAVSAYQYAGNGKSSRSVNIVKAIQQSLAGLMNRPHRIRHGVFGPPSCCGLLEWLESLAEQPVRFYLASDNLCYVDFD